MKNMKRTIELSKIPIEIELHHPDAFLSFAPYLTDRAPAARISVPPWDLAAARTRYEPDSSDAYIELMELCPRASDVLLPFHRVIFHGSAFAWRDKAWIFAAGSGTGKTTQYLLWKALWGEDIQIINGDKPILAFENRSIGVYPSPWNGKESMGQPLSKSLGGIILLKRSSENRIRRLSPQEAAGPLFLQFLFSRATTQDVRTVCQLEEELLNQVPLWLLENRGDKASAILCRNTLMEAQL